jgi:hypothetical protein
MHSQLLENLPNVLMNGMDADAKLFGIISILIAFSEERLHLVLTLG